MNDTLRLWAASPADLHKLLGRLLDTGTMRTDVPQWVGYVAGTPVDVAIRPQMREDVTSTPDEPVFVPDGWQCDLRFREPKMLKRVADAFRARGVAKTRLTRRVRLSRPVVEMDGVQLLMRVDTPDVVWSQYEKPKPVLEPVSPAPSSATGGR